MSNIIKTKKQIQGIRKSCKLAAECLEYIKEFVQPGITTLELNNKLDTHIRQNGATPACFGYMGYPKSVCISLNEVVCHGIPSEEVLKDGDILNIDVTTILDGYYGDTSKMFSVGEISEKAKDLIKVTEECLYKGIEVVKPGNYIVAIGRAIYQHATLKGYSVVHQFCGHGCGVGFHESPQIPHVPTISASRTPMMEGMVFTIEPMINEGVADAIVDEDDKWTAKTVDNKLSAQFEHMILVTNNGYEILT